MAVQKQTYVKAADNSGAVELMVFHIDGSTGKRIAVVGDIVTCTVKKALPGSSVKKKEIVKAVVVRTVKPCRRSDGSYIRAGDNAVVILKPKKIESKDDLNALQGTRIFGPVFRELRAKGYTKIISLAPEVL
ncbi:MAG: 50S ribosomal protein L14 [Candidatus Babeliaceae bacterium]